MLNVIENKTFTGEVKTIEITENTVIKHCQFINCLPGINDDIIRVIGKNVTVDIQYCTFDQSFINPDQYDEIISAINGPTINIYKSTFTGIGKVILCGNEDYPYSEEKTLRTALTNKTFPHGGYGAGTPIWTNAIDILNRNIVEIFKKYLKQNGIPIK